MKAYELLGLGRVECTIMDTQEQFRQSLSGGDTKKRYNQMKTLAKWSKADGNEELSSTLRRTSNE